MAFDLQRSFTYRMHLLHKDTDYESQSLYMESLGLSLSETRSLSVLGLNAKTSVMQLAELANLNKSQASRAAQVLIDKRLAIKHENPDDGRGIELKLTAVGERLWRKSMSLIETRNEQILSCLTAKEREALNQLIDKLLTHNLK